MSGLTTLEDKSNLRIRKRDTERSLIGTKLQHSQKNHKYSGNIYYLSFSSDTQRNLCFHYASNISGYIKENLVTTERNDHI